MTQDQTARPAPPYSAAPAPPQFDAGERRGRGRVLPILTLVVAVAAAIMAGIALIRHDESTTTSVPSSITSETSAEVAAAKKDACDAWASASSAMVAARQPFLDAPANWNDPANVSALTQAQAGILVQVEYLRQHVSPATPPNVAGPISEYIAANIDLAALDGQHESAAIANRAADRTGDAAAKVRAACGIS
jgi:hypothetical protein